MAGHSKWANIKHQKAKADLKKGKIFSRSAKEIITAVKMGGPDRLGNPRLRIAIEKAKEANVPNEIIDRNIKKASSADQADFTSITYELYGYGGVGIIVETMTDNKNRTASDMRIATNKRGGVIASPGAVQFNFDSKGVIQVPKDQGLEDEVFHVAIESGAEDFEAMDELYVITTDPTALLTVKGALHQKGYKIENSEVEMIPKVWVDCDDEAQKSNLALVDWLEALDDVDSVWHNMNMPD